MGWGKLSRKCQVSKDFFSGAEVANSFKHVLDEMEESKGRDNVKDIDLQKKLFKISLQRRVFKGILAA